MRTVMVFLFCLLGALLCMRFAFTALPARMPARSSGAKSAVSLLKTKELSGRKVNPGVAKHGYSLHEGPEKRLKAKHRQLGAVDLLASRDYNIHDHPWKGAGGAKPGPIHYSMENPSYQVHPSEAP
ncbi:hypothetical protein O6H91_11G008800 [Diphasiastrum complanatum]|uniref:Uncharacterized protein n=1 Tax=Diphasiastrum complanatum TaxID=34168 RepID=A0ACC2C648_DIPCM|nr:hypothetical protein O6H91_Y172100 [Diphasiastrum complanatum]KAJ7537509.1 hypothetical protein O6H91_11G008800 [Diphasiastrum complanatum]